MLYQMSGEQVSEERFINPPSVYRGAPFWAWNTYITKEMIDEQIACFKKMGMGGFHIHVRVGLKNQYLDQEFMELVRYCDEKAKENGMLCWLYDEDRYSSGTAGGEVTKQVKFRARHLRLTLTPMPDMVESHEKFLEQEQKNVRVPGCLLAVYDILLENGRLLNAYRINRAQKASGEKWYLYEELEKETPWVNNQTYVDTMNENATEVFLKKTYEKYAAVLQPEFGKSVPAIFTDEPHFGGTRFPAQAEGMDDILLPFSETLPERYEQVCGRNLLDDLPDVIWNRKGREISPERHDFFEACSEQFVSAYCHPIGEWCKEHGLLFTGHILGEESLSGQTGCVGEAMRCYREFQLPGIDNLCDKREYSAVKQAASAAHQYGRPGVLSELYGVTQWDFDFQGYKLAGDWQAALGVSVRVPHLAWASMEGEAKRDYPAAIGWQSPWYGDFHYIEDHFARVNYCMTRGTPLVHVGVIHPIETMWLYQGPADQMGRKREQLEQNFSSLTEWLLTAGIDFDYVSESSLETLGKCADGAFIVGSMKYDVILVPGCLTLRETTFSLLEDFRKNGGTVFLCGRVPRFIGCRKDARLEDFNRDCVQLPFEKLELLEALEPWREISVMDREGNQRDIYLHQIRKEGNSRWLFLAQAYKGRKARESSEWRRRPLHAPERLMTQLKGSWEAEKYDTVNGKIEKLNCQKKGKETVLYFDMYGDDSLLLHLLPAEEKCKQYGSPAENIFSRKAADGLSMEMVRQRPLPEPFSYSLDEPNVYLLDSFEYALDQETEYEDACELLKMDNRLRKRLGWRLRCESVEQPYVKYGRKERDVRDHTLYLRTIICSQMVKTGCLLALEGVEYVTGTLNGHRICMNPAGYYVDKAIVTVALPDLKEGDNELLLQVRYGEASNLEWMYLLGDFGVLVEGSRKQMIPKPERLFWGDYTRQGFPFYTGNMTYYVSIPQGEGIVQVPYYSGAAVKASANGGEERMMAFLPFSGRFKGEKEVNTLALTCLGNRYNGFGQLHLIGDDVVWLGPDSWRTEGDSWTDVYQLRPMGFLSAPLWLSECK